MEYIFVPWKLSPTGALARRGWGSVDAAGMRIPIQGFSAGISNEIYPHGEGGMRKSHVFFSLCLFLAAAMIFEAAAMRAGVTGAN